MDFGRLLHTAQKNGQSGKKEVRYYSTKFAPPKKEQRNKSLSVNIKNFLAKKEAEEAQKAKESKRKKEELLALRSQDKKATRRVNVMLKRTKSANKSVIQDAVDKDNTAVTLAGPSQPDEDDYGYVSQEAAAFYNKMMEKYSKMPDENKFSLEKKKKVNTANLNQLKDKVIAALNKEQEEANMPHKRKRKRREDDYDNNGGEVEESRRDDSQHQKPKAKSAAPPPMNFIDLLKIAEKKQFEPIVIEPKEKKEEERPLTKRQKKELEREKEWRERKEGKIPPNRPVEKANGGRIPKINGAPSEPKQPKLPGAELVNSKIPKVNGMKPSNSKVNSMSVKTVNNDTLNNKHKVPTKPVLENPKTDYQKPPDRAHLKDSSTMRKPEKPIMKPQNPAKMPVRQNSLPKNYPAKTATQGSLQKPVQLSSDKRPLTAKPTNIGDTPKQLTAPKKFPPQDLRPKQFPPKDLKPKQFPPADLKPKQFPPADLKPKQFPPADVRRKEFPPKDGKRKPINKRRILDDDDEEYDSEMDDFIDDGPEEGEDYSKYISEIFGYDKSKYRHVEDDDENMESSFSQQLKEEYISAKIGIMEDLEDIRKEEEEKRKKALMKKKRLN